MFILSPTQELATMQYSIIIIGSGLAGYSLAREFRKLNKEASVLMITADGGEYYSKPMLSAAHAKNKTPETLVISSAETMAKQCEMTVLTHVAVTAIDRVKQTVITEQGVFNYDRLVLAVGAEVFEPPIEGSAAAEVYTVNNLEDYARFRAGIDGQQHIVILGAGLIGCEFSNDLLTAGFQVTVVDPLDSPLQQLIPPEMGRQLQAAFAAEGVAWQLGKKVLEVNRAEEGLSVLLSDQTTMVADVVLSAVGLRFNKFLVEKAGLKTGRAIAVNRYLETSDANVYALGDCAEVEGLVLRYTMPLFESAKALAKTLAGTRTSAHYRPMPVVIKTPYYPLVVFSPPVGVKGSWHCEHSGEGIVGLFRDVSGKLAGFALSKGEVKQRDALIAELPDML